MSLRAAGRATCLDIGLQAAERCDSGLGVYSGLGESDSESESGQVGSGQVHYSARI